MTERKVTKALCRLGEMAVIEAKIFGNSVWNEDIPLEALRRHPKDVPFQNYAFPFGYCLHYEIYEIELQYAF